jgi:hypothetical protein
MARLRLEQILSNLSYNTGSNDLIVSGSVHVVSTLTQTGSLSIQNIDSFGDSGSFYSIDLGDNSF